MGTFVETVTIDASVDDVWNALSDIGAIHRWNPGVEDSRLTTTGDVTLGSARRCELGGKNYLDETVVEWVPGERLTMRIVGTNLPFKSADIGFTLAGYDRGTRVCVSPVYRLKFGPIGALLDILVVRRQYRRGMASLLRGLKRHVEATDR
ncbi:MAG: SRPBCC family protein [Acidobacteriota bacterium]|nr:SRPBCC family protein [Acidobacteriota bacterium]MDH3786663.1 SRPBCC family protein [Acidobacteriota bacterium]